MEKSRQEVEELQFYFLSRKAKEELRKTMLSYPELSAAYTGIYAEVYSKKASKGTALSALCGFRYTRQLIKQNHFKS